MKRNLLGILVLILAAVPISATTTNVWSSAAPIHDTLDGLFYTGVEFAAYRLAPTLQLYTSINGNEWTAHGTPLSPLSVGHDGHGAYYALTRTEESYTGGYMYTAHIWRSTNAVAWQYGGELITYADILPVSARFYGSESNLLVKVYTVFGNGSWTGFPPAPLFIADRTNTASFTQVPNGNDIESIQWTGSRFVATKDHVVIASSNGMEWTPQFSLSPANPPDQILTTWRSLFFISGYFSGITIANGVTEAVPLKTPVPFYEWQPLVAFSYNGNSLVLAGTNASYVSTNYSNTWSSNQLTSFRGLACNGTSFLMGDQVGTNWVAYKFTPSTNMVPELIPLRMDIQPCESVEYFVTNTFTGALLYPSETNASETLVQFEVSSDLQEWIPHGLPTTNIPAIMDIDQMDANSVFFRIKELKWE